MPSKKKDQAIHEIINSLTTINSSLQFIQKQHPEVKDYLFWEDVLVDIRALSARLTSMLDANQNGKSDPRSEVS